MSNETVLMSLNRFPLVHPSGIMAINKHCVVINLLSIQNREINKWKILSCWVFFFFLFKDLALYNREFKNSKKKKKKKNIFSPGTWAQTCF